MVSIIVISYCTRELVLECLKSVCEQTVDTAFQLIVVDNASPDDSVQAIAVQHPGARLIASDENIGFAAANNLAALKAEGNYIILLNPDTIVLDRAIDKLVLFADENPQFGIYGGRTLYPDGSLNPTSCWGRMTIWNSFCRAIGLSSFLKNYEFFNGDSYGAWQRDTVREVEIVSGCFLLIRRSLWEELGGFDLSYFMYGEDADLCLRARALGARCVICPEAEIIHYGGASEPVRADKLVRLLNAKSRLCISYGGRVSGRLLILTLWIWVLRRFVVDGLLGLMGNEERMKSASAWWEVAKRYAEWNPQSSPARPTRSG